MALVVAAVLAVLLLVSLAAAPARAAGTVTFGDPSATATFGTGITFSQPVRAPDVQARYVEILISRPGSPGPEVYPIAQTGDISTATFEYNLGEDTQHIFPNTRITARWRVTDTAGTVSLGPQASVTYADTRFSWQVVTGALVRVHWYKGDQGFGEGNFRALFESIELDQIRRGVLIDPAVQR